ncbi:cytochrome P450 [Gloeophyllum trabeum ATCC 11539]|uniref:Cytochrome P450 n=1 Tax=Gloeophyllum trabeum (strain ATCC 11539 / FP-39264 / Madison 617) TaxID=670483 RepID=S7QK33_GLOTA|nr:cytochrome P450 [Gloeophyllum trabeum ATCC 11539]EPQ60091.1 cytochrome P450 [Gloeophyllum trabeum ATCC 11539]
MCQGVIAILLLVLPLPLLYRRWKYVSIAYIQGPHVDSFILGNFPEYFQNEVGQCEFEWQERLGAVYRIKGLFGEDRLMIADPKALQHVYQTASTQWLKPTIRREITRMYIGRGIAWAEGEDHRRHRRIMMPAFGNIESRGMMPLFRETADRMCGHWKDIISTLGDGKSASIDVADWLSRATLDAIGEAAFGIQFGTMENKDDKLARSYYSLLMQAFGLPTRVKIFAQQISAYFPAWVFRLLERLPSRSLERLREVAYEGNRVAEELVQRKMEALRIGSEALDKDVMSLLVEANLSATPENKLNNEELYAQMRTILVAGHETSGNTLAFILYELSKNPSIQTRILEEIHSTLGVSQEYTMAQLDRMHYTLAVIKEVLRVHPVVYGPFLVAKEPDVIPLSKPIISIDGKPISTIPVSAGQYIHISLAGYNRLKDVWGEDAHEFLPERWLEIEEGRREIHSLFGVYSNLGNFVSGAISCLGWRFAVIEMQVFLVEIVRNFQFSLPPNGKRVIRATSGVMAPVLEGEVEKGKQLPLVMELRD